jgi:hypothetical protein
VQRQRWFTLIDADEDLIVRARAYADAISRIPRVSAEAHRRRRLGVKAFATLSTGETIEGPARGIDADGLSAGRRRAEAFMSALTRARTYRVERGTLQLLSGSGTVLAAFAPQSHSLAGT